MNYQEIIFLSLGTNLGDKKENLKKCIKNIAQIATVVKLSRIYQTPSIGFDAPDFYNMMIAIETSLMAFDLLDTLQSIEKKMGRKKTALSDYESRIIDIDIICYKRQKINTQKLTLPHPHFLQRLFVLQPFDEIATDYTPILGGQIVSELLAKCSDRSKIKCL